MFSLLTLSTKNSLGGGTETNISATNCLDPRIHLRGPKFQIFPRRAHFSPREVCFA